MDTFRTLTTPNEFKSHLKRLAAILGPHIPQPAHFPMPGGISYFYIAHDQDGIHLKNTNTIIVLDPNRDFCTFKDFLSAVKKVYPLPAPVTLKDATPTQLMSELAERLK